MSDNSKSQYTNRLTVHITGAMDIRLEQIASQREEPKAEIVRAALRAYLDEQEDLIGSRKHFTKMFQRRVDYVERLTAICLWINVQVMHMLYERVKKESYDLTELLEDAIGAGIATERHSYGSGAGFAAEDQTASRVNSLAARLERCIQQTSAI
jgi:predicted DNA-binding protein